MKRRKLRAEQPQEEQAGPPPRLRAGLYWTILAVLVVVAVWSYDRRELKEARAHMEQATRYEQQSDYLNALKEYRAAMENPRVSRRQKAELAIKMAKIYQDQLRDDELALVYYKRAQRWYPRSIASAEIKSRITEAQKRLQSGRKDEAAAPFESASDELTLAETPSEPLVPALASDREGPVVARIGDDEIHAAALARLLLRQSDAEWLLQHPDDPKLDKFFDTQMERELLFRGAIAEGYHRLQAVHERLYDYQRTLLSQQYAKEVEEKTKVVTDEEVRRFWEENKNRFSSPERLVVGIIRHTTESVVLEAKERLARGEDWAKVAEAVMGPESEISKGIGGTMSADDDVVPLIGKAPDLAKALRESKEGEVLGPIKRDGTYVLLSIRGRIPRKESTLDEVRGQIEVMLRSRKLSEGSKTAFEQLKKKLGFEMDARAKALVVGYAKKLKAEQEGTTITATNQAPKAEETPAQP